MKIVIILSFISLILFFNCENDDMKFSSAKLDTFLVVGDENASTRIVDTLIMPADRCDSATYEIDIDSDGINDVSFYVDYCFSPSFFGSNFIFNCLTDKVRVLTNDSILSPDILNYGDSLTIDKRWVNKSMNLLSASGSNLFPDEDGTVYKFGNWYDLSNKYIGILIDNEENTIYGWIKLSVPNDNWIKSLTIHEIGIKK